MAEAEPKKYTSRLANQHVLITGGTSGIGYGLAEALLEENAHVYIASSNPQRVAAAVSKLQHTYPSKARHVQGFVCDLGHDATLQANIAALLDAVCAAVPGGLLDHAVHTAGEALAVMPPAAWTIGAATAAATVRFWGALFLAQALRARVRPGPHASLTLTTGAVSQRPLAGWTVVAALAGGLHAMARNLAVDLAPLRVNLVSPGAVDTELWGEAREETVKAMGARTLTGRCGTVEDVVQAYLYLMKDENATGACVSTNGGSLYV